MTTTAPLAGDTVDEELTPVFPVLDTLRAVGALAVLTTHTAFWAGNYGRHGIWGGLLSRLDVGVAIFFVLSGFLLARPYLARHAASRPLPRTGRYYWKRLVRVYPVYAVTVVVTLLTVRQDPGFGAPDWVRTLLLLDIYADKFVPDGLSQMWSLAVEASFYVLLPGIMALALGRSTNGSPQRLQLLLGGALVLGVAWHLALSDRLAAYLPGSVAVWLPGFATWFAIGIGLALAHLRLANGTGGRLARSLASLGALPGSCWAAVAGLMLLIATPLGGPYQLEVAEPAAAVTKHLVYGAVGGLVVLTGVFARRDSLYTRVLGAPALRHLGHISYSTFCIHLPVLHLVMVLTGYPLFGGHGWQIWALTVLISLAASELLYRYVELPAMRLKDLDPPALLRRRARLGG